MTVAGRELAPCPVDQVFGRVRALRYNGHVTDLGVRCREGNMADETNAQDAGEPRVAGELARLRDMVESGTHHGESFTLTFTDREVEEALVWYARRHATASFPEARVTITPEGVELSGEGPFGGLHATMTGRADVYVQDGVPVVSIYELKMGKAELPDFLRFELEDQLNRQLALRQDVLPLVFDEIGLQEGRLTVRGRIR